MGDANAMDSDSSSESESSDCERSSSSSCSVEPCIEEYHSRKRWRRSHSSKKERERSDGERRRSSTSKIKKKKSRQRKDHRTKNPAPITYTALVKKDFSESYIPSLFRLESISGYSEFKSKVLNACSTSRTTAKLYYKHRDCKVQLTVGSWEVFLHHLQSCPNNTMTMYVETVSSTVSSATLQSRPMMQSTSASQSGLQLQLSQIYWRL